MQIGILTQVLANTVLVHLHVIGELVCLEVEGIVVVSLEVHDGTGGGDGVKVDLLLFSVRIEILLDHYFFCGRVHLPRNRVVVFCLFGSKRLLR